MATPNDPNIRRTAEELAFLRDAINSIGETVKDTLNARLEESDSILQRIQNNIKKDYLQDLQLERVMIESVGEHSTTARKDRYIQIKPRPFVFTSKPTFCPTIYFEFDKAMLNFSRISLKT